MRTLFIKKDGGIRWGVITSLISTICLVVGLLVGAGIQIGGFATNSQVDIKIDAVKRAVGLSEQQILSRVDIKDAEVVARVEAYKTATDAKIDRTVDNIYKMLVDLSQNGKLRKPLSDKSAMKPFDKKIKTN